jgi:hypothetical protein
MKKPPTDAQQVVAEALGVVPPAESKPRRQQEWTNSTHYVYLGVFEDRGLAFVKVGISDNPDRRMGEIGTGCPLHLKELFICQMPSREAAYGMEQSVLRRYSSLNTRGEWLRMEADAVRPWIARLSVLAMTRHGKDAMFKPHKVRKKYTPGYGKESKKRRA